MIEIARAIEGISLNGKEYLLNNDGKVILFESREIAVEFLKLNGFEDYSSEELENLFFFDEAE